jgi:LacI family transcriptional regulator
MASRVTIGDVARRSGVHAGTVSRALNERTAGQVNSVTRARIQQAARELGYVPNILARGLITDTSASIGVLVPDLTNPLFPPIVRGIESVLTPRGYTALIVNTDSDDLKERAAFDSLLGRRVDGFIIATGHSEHPLLRQAHERSIRVVTVNRGSPDAPFPLVTADNAEGMAAVVRHLLAHGHRHIVHLAGPPGMMTSRIRAETFRTLTRDLPHVRAEVVQLAGLAIADGHAAATTILATDDSPTALVATNDLVAIGALRAAREAGVDCPGALSITGFNDIPLSGDLDPALSTVRIPHFEMGVHAARLLLDELSGSVAGGGSPVTVTLPVEFIARRSSGPAPVRDR